MRAVWNFVTLVLVFWVLLLPLPSLAVDKLTTSNLSLYALFILLGATALILLVEKLQRASSDKAPVFVFTIGSSLLFLLVSYIAQWTALLLIVFAINALAATLFLTTGLKHQQFYRRMAELLPEIGVVLVAYLISQWQPNWLLAITLLSTVAVAALTFVRREQVKSNSYLCLRLFWALMGITAITTADLTLFSTIAGPVSAIVGLTVVVIYHYENESKLTSPAHLHAADSPDLDYYSYDTSTHLPNQSQVLKNLSQRVKQQPANWLFVAFKPINFREINEVLGHENADLLLEQLAYGLQKQASGQNELVALSSLHSEEKVARLQSTAFLVVLDLANNQYGQQSALTEIIKVLKQAVPEAFSFQRYSLNFKLAFGSCPLSVTSGNVLQALNYAVDALTEAEKNRLETVVFDSEKQLFAQQRLTLMEQLSHAIESEELQIHYQPQVNMKTGNVVGLEALMRWQHPSRGVIPADEFISLAEQSGLIFRLSKWMIEQVCSSVCQLHKSGLKVPISINFSSKDQMHVELVDCLFALMERFGVLAEHLKLELKESALLSSNENDQRMIKRINQYKLSLSIDDFSGSHQMFEHIRKHRIQQLKLDCSPLNNKIPDEADYAIIGSLVGLSQSIDVQTLAMNVESEFAKQHLLAMGAKVGQGFLFGKPMPLAILENWFKRKSHQS